MKKIILTAAIIAIAQVASASQLFDCGVPATADGHIRMGGSSYQVEMTNTAVYLIAQNRDGGRLRTTKTKMTKTFQGVDGAAFEANGVVVNWTNGVVTLDLGNTSALCKRTH